MNLFSHAHATHPQWRMAAAMVLAQLRAQMALPEHAASPPLALLYITDHYADEAQAILEHLSAELPEVTDWAGTVGVGIAANNVEYFDEPAMAVMLCDLAPDQYRVFSGVAPLSASGREGGSDGFVAHTALVHADGGTPEVAELIAEVADRTTSGYVFGGLASSRGAVAQFAVGSVGTLRGQGAASGVFSGGLSGVAFSSAVGMVSRVTQGAQPVDRERRITEAEGNQVFRLDGEPALDVLLDRFELSLERLPETVDRLRSLLVGLESPRNPATAPARGRRCASRASSAPTCWCATSSAWTPHGAASPWPSGCLKAVTWPFVSAMCRPRAPTSCACAPRCARNWSPKSWE